MKKIAFTVEHEGQALPGITSRSGADVWVTINGQTFKAEKAVIHKKGQQSASGGLKIISPMPGKVTKIFKSVGDKVVAGDSVVVVEAMKMEYTLKATASGSIKTIHFKEGSQVSLKAVLVELE